jgi:hypothetical protein
LLLEVLGHLRGGDGAFSHGRGDAFDRTGGRMQAAIRRGLVSSGKGGRGSVGVARVPVGEVASGDDEPVPSRWIRAEQ